MAEAPAPDTSQHRLKQLSSWRDIVDFVTKAGLTVIATTYVAGLLILNIHVGRYGTNYLRFLQVEYVMVGLLWALLVALAYSGAALLTTQIIGLPKEVKDKGLLRALPYTLLLIFAAVTTPLVVLGFLTAAKGIVIVSRDTWKALGVLVFNVACFYTLFTHAKTAPWSGANRARVWHNAMYLLYYVFLVVGPLGAYATYLYPRLPPAFGGGKKQKVTFVVKTDRADAAKAAGLELTADRRSAKPIEIIFEAPEFFLIAPPEGTDPKVKAVRVRKDMIDVTFYLVD